MGVMRITSLLHLVQQIHRARSPTYLDGPVYHRYRCELCPDRFIDKANNTLVSLPPHLCHTNCKRWMEFVRTSRNLVSCVNQEVDLLREVNVGSAGYSFRVCDDTLPDPSRPPSS